MGRGRGSTMQDRIRSGPSLVPAAFVAIIVGASGFLQTYLPQRSLLPTKGSTLRRGLRYISPNKFCTMSTTPQTKTMDILAAGIKAVAVGVKGSKPIPEDLVQELIEAMDETVGPSGTSEAQERLASFLGTLFVKHDISGTDEDVLRAVAARRPALKDLGHIRAGCSAWQLLSLVGGERASEETQELALKLLSGKALEEGEAFRLGRRLFDFNEPAPVLSLCVHILRVRYEVREEWIGLLKAQAETIKWNQFNPDIIKDAFVRGKQAGRKARLVVQLAEPFDGMNRGQLLTPLVAQHLQCSYDVVAVSQCGLSSGPKYGQNLLDIAKAITPLQTPFAKRNNDIADDVEAGKDGIDPPEFGWYIDQRDATPALDAWVELRRNIIKRPFLATSEKFINPCGASVLLASAFHPSYGEKMMMCAEKATDFKACIIVRKGLEGTIGLGLGRTAEILVGVRLEDGTYERSSYTFGAKDIEGWQSETDKMEEVNAAETAGNIKAYSMEGTSGDPYFDKRVLLTNAAIEIAMEWIMERL